MEQKKTAEEAMVYMERVIRRYILADEIKLRTGKLLYAASTWRKHDKCRYYGRRFNPFEQNLYFGPYSFLYFIMDCPVLQRSQYAEPDQIADIWDGLCAAAFQPLHDDGMTAGSVITGQIAYFAQVCNSILVAEGDGDFFEKLHIFPVELVGCRLKICNQKDVAIP